jgi:hypothetical protein
MPSSQVLRHSCVVIFIVTTLKLSSLMSFDDLVNISQKQSPVITRLHDCFEQAAAYAAAIRDNAQDDRDPIPAELVSSFAADMERIIQLLTQAATL